MGFETVILSVIKDVVRHSRAEFINGTLFVSNIDVHESVQVMNTLYMYTQHSIYLSKVGDEFSYDFT